MVGPLFLQRDGLRGFLAKLHPDSVAGRGDGHLPVAQLAHDVEGLLCRLLLREAQRVRLHLRLDCSKQPLAQQVLAMPRLPPLEAQFIQSEHDLLGARLIYLLEWKAAKTLTLQRSRD